MDAQKSQKRYNPLHNSQLLTKSSLRSDYQEKGDYSIHSQTYTKASSEITPCCEDQYKSLCQNYESKIKNMESGFEKSKAQFENTLKQMYKEKIVLLNIISHSQKMVDEFRKKVSFNPEGTFKEVESKYHLITSGLIHDQLCTECILNISKMTTQASKGSQGAKRGTERSSVSQRVRKLDVFKQYSWRHVPDNNCLAQLEKCKEENKRLGAMIEDEKKEKKEKGSQVQILARKLKAVLDNRITERHIVNSLVGESRKVQIGRQHQETRPSQQSQDARPSQQMRSIIKIWNDLLDDLNERVVARDIDLLNSKYKNRYL